MIIEIGYQEFKTFQFFEGFVLFRESEEFIELYSQQGYMLYKTVYQKTGDENDLIWKDENLKKAIRILSMDKGDVNIRISKE